jgi:regulator of protease activity HflC (stomatin/prohibitin superfamily)
MGLARSSRHAGAMVYLLAVCVVLGLLLVACVRLVAEGERLIVRRSGRRVRAYPPGVAFALPLVESVTRVSTSPQHVIAVAGARSTDGVRVRMEVDVTVCVRDVSLVEEGTPHAVQDAVEEELDRYVAANPLRALPGAGELLDLAPALPAGVELTLVRVSTCDVEVTPELRRLVRFG